MLTFMKPNDSTLHAAAQLLLSNSFIKPNVPIALEKPTVAEETSNIHCTGSNTKLSTKRMCAENLAHVVHTRSRTPWCIPNSRTPIPSIWKMVVFKLEADTSARASRFAAQLIKSLYIRRRRRSRARAFAHSRGKTSRTLRRRQKAPDTEGWWWWVVGGGGRWSVSERLCGLEDTHHRCGMQGGSWVTRRRRLEGKFCHPCFSKGWSIFCNFLMLWLVFDSVHFHYSKFCFI